MKRFIRRHREYIALWVGVLAMVLIMGGGYTCIKKSTVNTLERNSL